MAIHKNYFPLHIGKPLKNAQKGWKLILPHDGFLTGSSQVNKGGEAMQRNGFRVISAYTLGFIGILKTSLIAT
jgi:hypothetical protein